jgi:uncharacterized SAM-binding protein YcdF (DUF218 family)
VPVADLRFLTSDFVSAIASPSTRVSGKLRRWLVRSVWLVAAAGALIVAGYVFRAPLLTALARAWVVNEPAARAGAIVILGGGVENRPFAAARLFHAGVAPEILYMNVKLSPAEEMGVYPSEAELTRRILLSNNILASALQAIGTNVASTYDESRAVRAWVRQTGTASIVITTDLFHTRRARWIFRRELRDTPVKIYVVAVDPVGFKINDWWQNEGSVIQFQNEIIKSLYYWLKY